LENLLNTIRRRFHPLHKLRQIKLFKFISRRLPDTSTKYCGIKMFLSPLRDASWIALKYNMEVATRREFIKIIKAENIELFFDVGANLGAYTWTAREHGVKNSVMIEPDPTNSRLIRKTIAKNRINNCLLIEAAASRQVCFETFYQDSLSGATGSLVNQSTLNGTLHNAYEVGKEQFQVLCLPLDIFEYMAMGKNALVKIDVEGAELSALAGAKKFLEKIKPHLIIESFNYAEEIEQLLLPLGYQKQDLSDGGNILFSPSPLSL